MQGRGLIDAAGNPHSSLVAYGRGRASQVPRQSVYSFAAFPRPRTARHASPVAAFPVLPPH